MFKKSQYTIKLEILDDRANYPGTRVDKKVANYPGTRVLDTRRWKHYSAHLLKTSYIAEIAIKVIRY